MSYRILLIALAIGSSSASATSFDRLTVQLWDHPSVSERLEQSRHFSALSTSATALPNPELILGIDNLPVNNRDFDTFLPTAKVFGIRQTLTNRAQTQAIASTYQQRSQQARLQALYQFSELKSQLIQQLIARKNTIQSENLLQQQLTLYRLWEKELSGQLESGQPVYSELVKIDVERASILLKLNALRLENITVANRITALIGHETDWVEPPEVSTLPWSEEHAPLYPVAIAALSVQAATSGVNAAKAEFKPEYTLQALYKQRQAGTTFSGEDWLSVQASVSIPLWAKSNQTPKLRAAKATELSASYAQQDIALQWRNTMATLSAQIEFVTKNISLLEQKRKSLKDMLATVQHRYESGRGKLSEVLQLQIAQLNIDIELSTQKATCQHTIAQYNAPIQQEEQQKNHSSGDAHEANTSIQKW